MEPQLPSSKDYFQIVAKGHNIPLISDVLSIGRYLVGRSESCDIIIDSSVVSAVHAVIEVTPRGLQVFDMNSKNGTYIEGEKIVVKEVKLNETIAFGNLQFSLTKYQTQADLPPVLESLEPVGGNASLHKELPKTMPASSETSEPDVPYIVYPLSADPNSDYSEYIFEDKDELYPIFKYELNKRSVEVIILFKDKVYSVDYLPEKSAVYEIAGLKKKKKSQDVEFPYLGKEERLPFVEIQAGNCVVHQLHKYEMIYLTDSEVKKASEGRVNVQGNDIVKLTNGDLEIYVRRVNAPPKVKTAPFFRRDKEVRKYFWLMFFFLFLPLVSLYLYPVDEEKLKEKDPERIATILYKQKLKVNTNKAVEKTKKKQIKKKQKAKKKQVVKKQKQKKTTQANPIKSDQKKKAVVKDPGNKKAPKKQVVKKVKNPTPKKKVVKKQSSKSTASRVKNRRKQMRFSPTNTKAPGRVDVYKSMNFKSSISKLMAKGGSLSGAKTAVSSSSNLNSASVAGGVESIKKASVSGNTGSLVGSTVGKLATTRGSEGLSAKTGVYTAGIPSETVVLGSMDPDVIRRILREHIPQFRSCYQKELNKNTGRDISGSIRLVFTIGASGSVSRAGVDGRTKLPGRVKGCVVNVLRGIQFPSPLGGGTVDVKQPFNFYPKRI